MLTGLVFPPQLKFVGDSLTVIPNPVGLTKKLATSHGKTFGPLSVDNKSDFALPYVSLGNNFLAAQKLPVGQAQRQALSKLLSVSSGVRSATLFVEEGGSRTFSHFLFQSYWVSSKPRFCLYWFPMTVLLAS